MPRPLAPHGSKGAYERHKRAHERVCDACQAWKDAELADRAVARSPLHRKSRLADPDNRGTAPTTPSKPRKPNRKVDPVAETLDNLATVEAAMDTVAAETPDRLPALSKRRSELLRELIEYGGAVVEKAVAVDPLEEALDAGVSMDNVTRIA